MSLLVDLVILGSGFGLGWVTNRLFSNGFFNDSDDSDVEDEELDAEYSRSDEPNAPESPIRVGDVKPNRSRVHRRLRRLHRRRQLNRCHHRKFKNTRKGLIEAIERNTKALNSVNPISSESIESLENAISSLNETLKKVNLARPTEDNCDLIEDDKVESSKGMEILFTDPPKPANTYAPEFYGSTRGIQDESAGMHIYDANFKPPKCDWTLNTDCSQEPYDYWKKRLEPQDNDEKKETHEKSSSATRNELRDMFQDCRKDKPKKEPSLLTKPGGGYANMGDLNSTKKEAVLEDMERSKPKSKPKGLNKNVLSRGDELDVINSFSNIKGMGWEEAKNLVQEQGYSLHPSYINEVPEYALEYSKTVLGVRVKDLDFDPRKGRDAKGFSDEATILAVVDVGGQDTHKRALSTM
jgi:hypothetical protein